MNSGWRPVKDPPYPNRKCPDSWPRTTSPNAASELVAISVLCFGNLHNGSLVPGNEEHGIARPPASSTGPLYEGGHLPLIPVVGVPPDLLNVEGDAATEIHRRVFLFHAKALVVLERLKEIWLGILCLSRARCTFGVVEASAGLLEFWRVSLELKPGLSGNEAEALLLSVLVQGFQPGTAGSNSA